ncbi:ParB/RepB/Spo0J family partition protein [Rhizobacter sp. SG703]|uniref:ParB/RepB/Spo0J family partition protein n=1 Tax=Rhizobacter sp. SG703 TaxID=2587140 RepID=UPI0014482830|nr:ParB/RepB/Spo0J family partition protein [Rhizobacter sp. SG703]NKI97563.1 ParB/RepB/Spo0J family partition protein [Rhizobacter sp. SG703]
MEIITSIPLAQLRESPFNPRRTFTGIDELAASIVGEGRIHEPLLVRLIEAGVDGRDAFEIVFGHRRFRAAAVAELETAPCMIRTMTDAEARSAQIAENLQRADVHPLEEAEGFQALIDSDNLTLNDLAQKFGKSRSYIHSRVTLLKAIPSIRKACLDGEVGTEVVVLFARLREPALQEKALSYVSRDYHAKLDDGGKRSYRRIKAILSEKFTLSLSKAIFDIEDEMLVPSAGHCVRCPKRTGNAPEFEDIAAPTDKKDKYGRYPDRAPVHGPDVCTDPDCFAEKKKAHLKREAEKLEAAGKTVMQGNKARQAIDASGNVKAGFVKLADVRDALKKAKGARPTVVTLQDPRDGKTHQVVKVDELKAAGVKVTEPKPARGYGESEEDRKKREAAHAKAVEKARAEIEGRIDLLTRVRAAAAAAPRSAFDLQMVAQVACAGVGWKDKETLAELYGVERSALESHISTLPLDALTLFILDCALVQNVRVESYALDRKPEQLLAAAVHYRVLHASVQDSAEERA